MICYLQLNTEGLGDYRSRWQNMQSPVTVVTFIYLFIIGFIYRLHVLTSRSGRVFSCALGRPFVIERQVCSLSTKPQMWTTLNYTITVCCTRTAYNHTLPLLAFRCRGPKIKSQICSDDLNPRPFALAAECITTRPPRPHADMADVLLSLGFSTFDFAGPLSHENIILVFMGKLMRIQQFIELFLFSTQRKAPKTNIELKN